MPSAYLMEDVMNSNKEEVGFDRTLETAAVQADIIFTGTIIDLGKPRLTFGAKVYDGVHFSVGHIVKGSPVNEVKASVRIHFKSDLDIEQTPVVGDSFIVFVIKESPPWMAVIKLMKPTDDNINLVKKQILPLPLPK